jgi:hypothetical protein
MKRSARHFATTTLTSMTSAQTTVLPLHVNLADVVGQQPIICLHGDAGVRTTTICNR